MSVAPKGGSNPHEGSSKSEDESKEGPIAINRHLLEVARDHNVVSIVYYYSLKFSDIRSTLPYMHFETGKITARSEVPPKHAAVLERCHEFILQLGRPIVLSKFLPAFAAAEPKLTREIISRANDMGVYDQYMVPVFGPYNVNGVIAFGFAEEIAPDSIGLFHQLESTATSHHNRLVRHFMWPKANVELSSREREVLTWIARGKSTGEISTILEISKGSVDTYTRRIFEKMGVNSRVTAAIAGVTRGLVETG